MVYNSPHSFSRLKDIDEKFVITGTFYIFKFSKFKTVVPQTNENKDLKSNVLDNTGDLFNELYYIYKDKYNDKQNSLNTKDKKKSYNQKLRLTDDYQYESEEEQKEQQAIKQPDKNELPKKSTKDDLHKINEWVIREETDINFELFKKHFGFQKPSDVLNAVYTTNDKNKNNSLVNVIKSRLGDLKNEI